MLCPLCHTPNRENAKFCKGCGRTLPEEPVGIAQTVPQAEPTKQAASSGERTPSRPLPAGGPEEQPKAPANGNPDDPSLAPTQILSPQQMIAFHARLWQQELEQHEHEHREGNPGVLDIADAPTMLFTPTPPPPPPSDTEPTQVSNVHTQRGDIAEMPTVIMAPQGAEEEMPTVPAYDVAGGETEAVPVPSSNENAAAQDATVYAEQVAPTEVAPTEVVPTDPYSGQVGGQVSSATPSTVEATVPAIPEGEESMEQAGQGTTPEQNQDAFPALSIGTLVAGRYEVTQVLDQNEREHLYEVVDRQGYHHCWNCGSDQNAEGDEYCIDCGASLSEAAYIMHAFPAVENKDQESHILHGNIIDTLVDQGATYVIEQPQPEQLSFPNGVHLEAACDSDAGAVRRSEPNEDSTLVLLFERVHESVATPSGIFVIADGMGGHDYGQVASRTTIGVIAERVVRELLLPPLSTEKAGEAAKGLDEDSILLLVQNVVQDANTTLCQVNQRDKTDMGSTLTGFMMVGDHAYIFNVGDSRTYMLRDEKLYQLTNDHSLVGQLVAGGLIEPDEVYTHPQRSQIYRSIGDKLNVQIDIFKQQVHPGDILLSCSDGLWEMVRDPQISEILNSAPDPQTACSQLIEAANTNGGEDNVSAVVVFVR